MRKLLSLTLIVLLPLLLAGHIESSAQSTAIVFTHATVIDMTGSQPKPDMTVVVVGNRIAAIGKSGSVSLPKGAQVIDATGNYLIPGLWDMHVHTPPDDSQTREIFLPLAIANGVTGERHMFGTTDALKQKADIQSGALLGPRLIVGSTIVDGPNPMWDSSVAVADAAAGRQAVRSLKQAGYDFIKVYQFLARDVYFAIADEAKKQNITFAGHVPFSVNAAEASDAGHKSIEHLTGINLAVSKQEAKHRATLADAAARVGKGFPEHATLFLRAESEPLAAAGYDQQKADALFKHLAKNGTHVVPTLALHRAFAWVSDPAFRNDFRLKYMPLEIRQMFIGAASAFPNHRAVYEQHLRTVGAMHRAGVKILAGTDPHTVFIFPGFSLHDELAQLVEAGLTPMEALQTATVNAARFLNLQSSMGTIEKGKIADLVLLEANPLENISNTKKIAAVVANGKYIAKAALQKILMDVEAAANKK